MEIKTFKEAIVFIGSINNIDLTVTEDEFDFCIVSGTRTYATVSKHLTYSIDTGFTGYSDLSDSLRNNLLGAMYEFAKTSIDERGYFEQKYYLKHKFFYSEPFNYLNRDNSVEEWRLNNKSQTRDIQTQFTQKEIDELKEKYDTDLKDFKQIEVKNEG